MIFSSHVILSFCKFVISWRGFFLHNLNLFQSSQLLEHHVLFCDSLLECVVLIQY